MITLREWLSATIEQPEPLKKQDFAAVLHSPHNGS
jgi:hypothetical protein